MTQDARHGTQAAPITNLVQLFEESCHRHADRRLFGTKTASGWEWLTYRQVGEQVDDFRGALAKLGVGPGDRVAMVADNRVEWAVACYATYGLGAVFVPMYQAQLAKEWEFILHDCSAKVAIAATPEIAAALGAMRADVPTLEHVVGLELPASDDHAYQTLLEIGRRTPVPSRDPAPRDVAGLIYTSGTDRKSVV